MIINAPASRGTQRPARRSRLTSDALANATATAAAPTMRPMPTAYATKSAAPATGEPARKLATTMARNGPMVQVSEATAYAAPKPIIEASRRVSLGPFGLQPSVGSDRPASNQTPSSTTTTPMTTVTQGR